MILPDELRTKDSNIHICPKYSNRPFCNVFVATGQWPSDTEPPDALPSTSICSTDRLPTPCPLPDISSVGRILLTLFIKYASFKPHYHWWSRGVVQLLPHSKGICIIGCCCQMMGHQMSVAVHRSQGITYDPVFSVSDWLSHRMGTLLLIFPSASIKLCFKKCCQTPLMFGPHQVRWKELAILEQSRGFGWRHKNRVRRLMCKQEMI